MLRPSLVSAALLLLVAVPPVQAQFAGRSLVSQTDANRVSLRRAWFTRARVDPARGRIAHVTQHVSSTHAYTVYEVTYDGGKRNFSERDLDRFGDPLGKAGAKRLADRNIEDLKRLDLNPRLTTQTVPEISLYIMTNLGMVHAIDGETGRTRWTTPVGNPNFPSEAPGANDDYVAVVNGSSLYVLNQSDGKIAWHRMVRGAPGAGPAVGDNSVYVPMVNGIVESYLLTDYRKPPGVMKSHGRALIQPVYTGMNVAWPTDRGYLYVGEGARTEMRYRLETNDRIVAPAVPLSPSRILTASTDGYLYCIEELNGSVKWRFSTGEPISAAPVAIEDAIYLVTDDRSLFRISANVGQLQWVTSGIRGFLAASQKRLYCTGATGRLVILDAETGSQLGSLPTEIFDLRVLNADTDRIFMGSRSGVIQCLHEVAHQWPHIHSGVLEEKPAQAPSRRPTKPRQAEPEKPADPFGGGGAADPFGGGGGDDKPADPFGGGGSDPFGGGGGSGGDPFGGGGGGGGGDDPFGGGGGGSGDDPFGSGSSSGSPF